MKRNILKRILTAILAATLLLLCGCASIKEGGAFLDGKLEQFMTCIEANDKEGAAELAYNQELGKNMRDAFDGLAAYWPAKASDAYTRQFIRVNSRNMPKIYQGTYLVESGSEEYIIDIAYVEDENGAGITMLRANLSSEVAAATTPTGTLQTAAQNTPLQWCFLALWPICIAFVIFTIVDILRKKPRYYGLWVFAAIIFLSVGPRLSETSVHFDYNVGILLVSQWLKYPDGALTIVLALPAGSIAYWCVRDSLLRKKEAREAAMAANAQFQTAAPQPPYQAPEAVIPEAETEENEEAAD